MERAEAAAPVTEAARREFLALKAEALFAISSQAFGNGDNEVSIEAAEAGIAIAREINVPGLLVRLLGQGSTVHGLMGNLERARAYSLEGIALGRQHGLVNETGLAMSAMDLLAFFAGDPNVLKYAEETVQIARRGKNPWLIALGTHNAGRLAALRGNVEEAIALFEEAAAGYKQVRDHRLYTSSRSDLAHLLRQSGRHDEARVLYRKTLAEWQEYGNRAASAHQLECFGMLAAIDEDPERAARLFGAAEALREVSRSQMTLTERQEYDEAVAQVREQLGEAMFAATWRTGRALNMEEAIALALE